MRARGAEREAIEDALLRENEKCDPRLNDDELRKIAESACKYPPNPRPKKHQPLREFLFTACAKNNLEFCRSGNKWTPLFVFARFLRGRAEFAGMSGLEAAGRIERELRDEWKAWFGDVSSDPRAQFVVDWNRAHTAAGEDDGLDRAWRALRQWESPPITPPRVYSENYCWCVSLAAVLQHNAGAGKPFPLAQLRIADLCGVHQTMVSQYLRWQQQDGLLREVKKYVRKLQAAEYIYTGPPLPERYALPASLLPEALLPESSTLTRVTLTDLPRKDGIGKNGSGKSAPRENEIGSKGSGYVEFLL
jgi:hypothetical protein